MSVCPVCQASSSGKFCSNCGAPLSGAACANCGASLTPGARFCHKCGAPASAAAAAAAPSGSSSGDSPGQGAPAHASPPVLPWAVTAIALVALIAMIAGQRFGQRPATADASGQPADSGAAVAPFAGGAAGAAQAPDISSMTPTQRAVALYNLVMSMHERGSDSAQTFAPMAIQAYQMIDSLSLDDRYDMGRIAAIGGNEALAKAQSDTILAANPNHLLGLILAANAAHMRHDSGAERAFQQRLVAAAPAERAKALPEYTQHANDITVALDQARGR